jgi:hypothetical protein
MKANVSCISEMRQLFSRSTNQPPSLPFYGQSSCLGQKPTLLCRAIGPCRLHSLRPVLGLSTASPIPPPHPWPIAYAVRAAGTAPATVVYPTRVVPALNQPQHVDQRMREVVESGASIDSCWRHVTPSDSDCCSTMIRSTQCRSPIREAAYSKRG